MLEALPDLGSSTDSRQLDMSSNQHDFQEVSLSDLACSLASSTSLSVHRARVTVLLYCLALLRLRYSVLATTRRDTRHSGV
jgi:hypothetical protein